MSHFTFEIVPLPPVRRLDRARQLRFVSIAALAVIALAVVIGAAHVIFASRPPAAPALPPGAFRPTAEQRAQLSFSPVQFGANADLVRASGSISADADHSTPILLPFSGQVMDVMVEAGQRVTRGQPLMRIASPELVDARNALLNAAAQQASTAEALRIATANAARQKAIFETAGGAQKDYLQAQADLVTAQANLRTAQSALRAARDRLGLFGKSEGEIDALASPSRALGGQTGTIYRAPVSGLIADRSVAPGQFLTAGGSTALMTITDPSHVWLVAQLPESEAANVHLGDSVVVTTPALPGREFHARIDNIAASLDPNTHRLPVRATVDNPDGSLKPQMFASFTIRRALGGAGGVLVPTQAVIHENDSARVWVLGRDGLLYGRQVETGDSEAGFTRVTRGLKLGDRIVTRGALFVNEAGLDQ